jgi:uncharacterized protein (TIGR00156 family)
MRTKRLIAASTLLAITATATHAQFTGPGATQQAAPALVRSVAEVLAKPVNDQNVELTGTLVRQLGRETYLFRDATGEIQVEIDREDFPGGQPVSENTRVLISGEVDTRVLKAPEIDVETLRLAPAAT